MICEIQSIIGMTKAFLDVIGLMPNSEYDIYDFAKEPVVWNIKTMVEFWAHGWFIVSWGANGWLINGL